jgi:hypothetical protein
MILLPVRWRRMINPAIVCAIACGVIYIVGYRIEYRTTHAAYQPRIEPRIERQSPEPPSGLEPPGSFLYGWHPNEGYWRR